MPTPIPNKTTYSYILRLLCTTYLILFLTISLLAQSESHLRGIIIDNETSLAVAHASVQIMENEQWTTSNMQGEFYFKALNLDKFTIKIQSIGYQEFFHSYRDSTLLTIALMPQSYAMEEIIVTAQQSRDISTTSKINSSAMEHVQPTTLGDVMQLLPGNLIENTDLSKRQSISIREIGSDDNSAAGTAIIIDGAPLNNDANLQNDKLSGIDLRQISTNNIASVEVIKGIPSASYGNLTSGAVIVKTKSGYTPYALKFKTDPKLKEVSLAKGYRLNKGGAFNANIDYTQSFSDLRSKYQGFNRLTGQLGYSRIFLSKECPLSFNSKLSIHHTLDQEKTDPDALQPEELIRANETGLSLNIYGQWALNKRLVSNLKYSLKSSIKAQEDYEKHYRSSGLNRISFSLVEGENEGRYLASESLTELTTKGLPINLFAQISANKNISSKSGFINNSMLGMDYRLSGNYGAGQIYDIMNPPTISYSSSRPRSFKDIPASETIALFAENKTTVHRRASTLDVMTGLRVSSFQANMSTLYWEPRLNVRYRLIDQPKHYLSKLSVHGGIGLNYKMPSLQYLYPAPAYFDVLVMDYYPSNPDDAQVWFYTHIINNTSNADLKPSQNLKQEIGFNIKIGAIIGDVTYFDEKLENGFGAQNKYYFTHNTTYITDDIPTSIDINKNTLETEELPYIISHAFPVNNKTTYKQGIEYSFSFGRIKALSTKVSMNGAWLHTKRIYSTQNYAHLPSKNVGRGQYDEIGIYPAGKSKISDRLNTTFRFVTHLPQMRLIFTTSVQITWLDKYYYPQYDEAPIYLYSEKEGMIPFTNTMRNSPPYSYDYIKTTGANYYLHESLPPLLLCNFKLSKEIAKHLKLSFYANNFTNYRPIYQSTRSYNYSRRNPSIYFGAELHYIFKP